MGVVHDGMTIALVREHRPSLEDFARPFGLGYTGVTTAAGNVAPVEIHEHYFVSLIRIAGDDATAAILRIAGMAAGHDDLKPFGGLREESGGTGQA
jgi:hypothetical protein